MGTTASNFEAQVERRMGVDAPVREGARPGEESEAGEVFEALIGEMRRGGFAAADAIRAAEVASAFFAKMDAAVCEGMRGAEWVAEDGRPDRLFRALGRVWRANDARFSLGCLFLAMDCEPPGVASLRKLGEARGLSPERVSLEVEAYQEILGLPRTKLQKSAAAVASYKRTNGAKWKPGMN